MGWLRLTLARALVWASDKLARMARKLAEPLPAFLTQ
jgi:hypothetical protein